MRLAGPTKEHSRERNPEFCAFVVEFRGECVFWGVKSSTIAILSRGLQVEQQPQQHSAPQSTTPISGNNSSSSSSSSLPYSCLLCHTRLEDIKAGA